MDLDIRQFEKRLVECQVVDATKCSALLYQFESESNGQKLDSENLAHWLTKQKVISPFQADILLNEPSPRLQYGNYQIIDRIDDSENKYTSRHRLTGHPVILDFISGDDAAAIRHWKTAKSTVAIIASSPHPNLLAVYESVAIPEYRFIVSEHPAGKPIEALVPDQSRITSEKADRYIFQIASALQHLASSEIETALNLGKSIWVKKNGQVKIRVPLANDFDAINQAVSEQIALLWYRLVCGRLPNQDPKTGQVPKPEWVRLKKYGMEVETIRLVRDVLMDVENKTDVFRRITDHLRPVQAELKFSKPPDPTLTAYQNWLTAEPGLPQLATIELEAPALDLDDDKIRQPFESAKFQELPQELTTTEPTSKHSRRLLAPAMGSVAMLAAIVIGIIVLTNRLPNEFRPSIANNSTDEPEIELANELPPSDSETSQPEIETPVAPTPESFVNQILIDDNDTSLWESPTTGPPIDFRLIPAAPKIVMSVRLAELLESIEGQKFVQGLGMSVEPEIELLEQTLAIERTNIQQLTVSFHSNDNFEYDLFFIVALKSPSDSNTLAEAWDNTETRKVEDSEYWFQDEQNCFATFANEAGDLDTVVYGPENLVQDCLQYQEIATVSGIMKRLSKLSDENRHFNFLALRSGLFGNEGQKLMAQNLGFNRLLSGAISRVVRGFNISLHFNDGAYMELAIDQSADITQEQLAEQLSSTLHDWNNELANYTTDMIANPYWDPVRLRIQSGFSDFVDHFRIGIENRELRGNGWYPAAAPHNWLVASHLLLTYGQSQFDAKAQAGTARKVPQSLEELLSETRDLSVSTSPDLILLMKNLQQEITDDYGKLPFDFEIRLSGSDLEKEGITQNQRPNDLDVRQKPLSDILTEIMVKANPDKNISGPNDANCKLVWVIAPAPEAPDREIILITTRAAAETKSYALPAAFQINQ